jgi:hypothetical protein
MSQFMVLLYDSADAAAQWTRMSPEEMQQCIEQYVAWSRSLEEKGVLIATEKLRDGVGRVLRGRGGRPAVTDGPFTETNEIIGGYFLVEAADLDEAAALCHDCPHLEFGGTIEIREIEPVGGPIEEAPLRA